MESYFRYIGYIDILEEEKQIKTAGYLIWKYQNKNHNLEIQIKDNSITDSKIEIREESRNELLGEIHMDKGYGEYKETFPEDKLGNINTDCGKLINPKDITGIHAYMEDGRKLYVRIKLPIENKDDNYFEDCQPYIVKKEDDIYEELSSNYKIREEGRNESKEEAFVKNTSDDKAEDKEKIRSKEADIKREKKGPKILEPMKEDKWEQLCKKYGVISPFPSKSRFVSIKPEDFVILQEGYQKLVHNSFLLHGYYQYGHIILGRLEEKEDMPYYIGVPGVFYEGEKKAARMFGFVGFEGVENIIENGSFGYYMIEVKI